MKKKKFQISPKVARWIKKRLPLFLICFAVLIGIGFVASFATSPGNGGGGGGSIRPPGSVLGPSSGENAPIVPELPEEPDEGDEEDLVYSEGLEYKSNGDGTCSVIGIGTFTGTDLVIPSKSPEGDKVVKIGELAFLDEAHLLSVKLPSTLKDLGLHCFKGCTCLTTFVIPDSVTNVSFGALEGCLAIESITLPFLGKSKTDESKTFLGYIWGAVTYKENSSYVPPALTDVTLTGDRCPAYGFYGLTYLERVNLSDEVTKIEVQAFYSCKALESSFKTTLFHFPRDLKTIATNAFYKCSNFEYLLFPEGLETIGYGSFSYCTKIEVLELPDSVKRVEQFAFYENTALRIADLGDGLLYLGPLSFSNCVKLSNYVVPPHLDYVGYNCLPSHLKTTYVSDWLYCCFSTGSFSILEGIYGIVQGACESVTSIYLPSSLKIIEGYAFNSNKALKTVTCDPECVLDSVGKYAFSDCTSLTSFSVPVRRIENNAFQRCSKLQNFSVSAVCNYIGANAFLSCSALTSVDFESCTYWYVSDSSLPFSSGLLEDPGEAAALLTKTYTSEVWKYIFSGSND